MRPFPPDVALAYRMIITACPPKEPSHMPTPPCLALGSRGSRTLDMQAPGHTIDPITPTMTCINSASSHGATLPPSPSPAPRFPCPARSSFLPAGGTPHTDHNGARIYCSPSFDKRRYNSGRHPGQFETGLTAPQPRFRRLGSEVSQRPVPSPKRLARHGTHRPQGKPRVTNLNRH